MAKKRDLSKQRRRNLYVIESVAAKEKVAKRRDIKKQRKTLPPASIVHMEPQDAFGSEENPSMIITLFDYSSDYFVETKLPSVNNHLHLFDKNTVRWINVNGLHDVNSIHELCKCFDIHPLTIEDIFDTRQRPKFEEYEKYIYIDTITYKYDSSTDDFISEQVSIVLGNNFVISFNERETDSFEIARGNLRNPASRTRKLGADYLVYSLLDILVDDYFAALELLSEKIEDLEENILDSPEADTLQHIQKLKRRMIFMHKLAWSMRDIISSMSKRELSLVSENLSAYLRDLYDHIIQVIDTTETLRDLISGILDIYLSSVSNRLNEVMKVLTIISTIFIPLSFISGFYGMNFVHMPELAIPAAYPIVAGFMLLVAISMLIYFKKRKWW